MGTEISSNGILIKCHKNVKKSVGMKKISKKMNV
jgi:hypothetical protein